MKKIFIRADGSRDIGLGHVMRMLVLAKELQKNYCVEFLCRNDNKNSYKIGIDIIRNNGFKVIEISENEFEKEIIKIQLESEAALLITDSYEVDEEYFNLMSKYFFKTMYMDDINVCKLNVDLILNQNINAVESMYEIYNDSKLLLGTKYILLRDEFRNINTVKKIDKVKDIMVTLGGTDEKEISLKIIRCLKELTYRVHVVIGSAFKESVKNKIYDISNSNNNIIIHENACMSEIMSICDLAISACGTTIYELCAMEVPTIAIVIASNQYEIAKYMGQKGMIINSDNLIMENEKEFSKVVEEVISNKKLRLNLVMEAKKIVNKNGVEEVCKEIIHLIE